MSEEQQTADAMREAEHWKFVAAYLASCHAATLEGMSMSAPKSARARHVQICKNAADYLRGKNSPPWLGHCPKSEQIEHEIMRCENAAAKCSAL